MKIVEQNKVYKIVIGANSKIKTLVGYKKELKIDLKTFESSDALSLKGQVYLIVDGDIRELKENIMISIDGSVETEVIPENGHVIIDLDVPLDSKVLLFRGSESENLFGVYYMNSRENIVNEI